MSRATLERAPGTRPATGPWIRTAAAVALAIAALGRPVRAQQMATLAGHVTFGQPDTALALAHVVITGSLLGAVTDAHGAYVIRGVPPGSHRVRVSILGYVPQTRTVSLAAGSTHIENFSLATAPLTLAPVSVSASRGLRALGDVPASQAVVSSRELVDRNVITLDQALRFVPGVSFNNGDIDIRGSTGAAGGVGSRVLMLVDGHPVLSADGAEVDYNSLPLLDVDRVEIIKGAYSALWGSSALGGVVDVITSPIDSEPETIGTLHYGAYDQPPSYRVDDRYPSFSGIALQHSRRIGDVGVLAMVDRESSSGFREDDHSSRWLVHGKVDVPIGDHPLTAYAIYSTEDGGNFFMWDSAASPTRPPSNTVNDWAHSTKLSAGASIAPIARNALRLQIDPYLEQDGTRNHFASDSDFSFHNATKVGTNVQLTLAPSVAQTITVGGEASHTDVSSDILGHPSLRDLGLYAQDEAWIRSWLSATAGMRVDAHRATGSPNETTLNPKLGLVVHPSADVSLRASVARGYRAPAAIEQFVNSRQDGIPVHPNPHLHGETAWSGEVGATATVTPRFWFDAAAFQTNYRDLIGPGIIPDSGIVFQFQNVQRARVRGVDLSTKTQVVPRLLDVDVNYTFLDTYDFQFRGPLPYRSRHYVTTSLNFLRGLAGLDVQYRSRVERVLLFPADPRGAITLVDLRLGYLVYGTYVQARVSNLFQQRYVDIMERTPGAPRSILLSMRRAF